MARSIPTSEALASMIESLGGSVIPGDSLMFDLPVGLVRETIPKLNEFVGVKKVSERTEMSMSGPQTIVRCTCTKNPPKNDELVSDLGKMLLQ